MTPLIQYLLIVPDWEMEDVSPIQGFTSGVLDLAWALAGLTRLPSNVIEWAFEQPRRLALRSRGQARWRWAPLASPFLSYLTTQPEDPFAVIFTHAEPEAKFVSEWATKQALPVLHVSAAAAPGAIEPSELTADRLQRYCRDATKASLALKKDPDGERILGLIEDWRPPEAKCTDATDRWLGPATPNEVALQAEGLAPPSTVAKPNNAEAAHVAAIAKTALEARGLRDAIEHGHDVVRAYPERADVILFAPAMYRHIYSAKPKTTDDPLATEAKRMLRLLQRQSTYTIEAEAEEWKRLLPDPAVRFLLQTRARELNAQSAAIGVKAASTAACVIRATNAVNRTSGLVRQLANHWRADTTKNLHKTRRVFNAVQHALAAAIDPRLLDIVTSARSGVKLIADAPLEWLPADGLPLFLRHNVSRIPATPGNLMFGELPEPAEYFIHPDLFSKILVLRSFKVGDPIQHHLATALAQMPSIEDGGISAEIKDVQTTAELVAALNAYNGPMVIFDMHGGHSATNDVGVLRIGDEDVDVWLLRAQARMPPIAILSACDTHALDRSHVTPANGLMSCGVRAVLAAMLPIASGHAAVLAARLAYRARAFSAGITAGGRIASWTDVVSGMLRMQYCTDALRQLLEAQRIDDETFRAMNLKSSMLLNPLQPGWHESFLAILVKEVGMTLDEAREHASEAMLSSDVLKYVHLGAPESILIGEPDDD